MAKNFQKNICTANSIQRIKNVLGLSELQIAKLIGAPTEANANCIESGGTFLYQSQLNRIIIIEQVFDLAAKVYKDEGREFFITPLPEFEGRCALDLLMEGNFDSVESALAADYEGLGG